MHITSLVWYTVAIQQGTTVFHNSIGQAKKNLETDWKCRQTHTDRMQIHPLWVRKNVKTDTPVLTKGVVGFIMTTSGQDFSMSSCSKDNGISRRTMHRARFEESIPPSFPTAPCIDLLCRCWPCTTLIHLWDLKASQRKVGLLYFLKVNLKINLKQWCLKYLSYFRGWLHAYCHQQAFDQALSLPLMSLQTPQTKANYIENLYIISSYTEHLYVK